MLRLGVNIDHAATLREARYRGRTLGEPDPVEAALACEDAGAHGITVHLREDRRHIQDRDVYAVRQRIRTRMNLEMAIAPAIVEIAVQVRPDIVCLVPERREEVTTEGGLDVAGQLDAIRAVCDRMRAVRSEVSLFINADPRQIDAAARTGAEFVELHTGAYAEALWEGKPATPELERLADGARHARQAGLRVNAGHGLSLGNLPAFLEAVPHLEELNIGHSLLSRALVHGLRPVVAEFLALMAAYRLGPA